jgi:hypothetical protein
LTDEQPRPRRDARDAELERRRRLAAAFGDPLPESTSDEREGWGEGPQVDDRRDEDWFRSQVPPHHG